MGTLADSMESDGDSLMLMLAFCGRTVQSYWERFCDIPSKMRQTCAEKLQKMITGESFCEVMSHEKR